GGTAGGPGRGPQPHQHSRAVPPRGGGRRIPHGLRRWLGAQDRIIDPRRSKSMKRHMVHGYLQEILEDLKDSDGGEVADYIPELANADPGPFAVALATTDGAVYSAGLNEGDDEMEFTIQSASKPFVY